MYIFTPDELKNTIIFELMERFQPGESVWRRDSDGSWSVGEKTKDDDVAFESRGLVSDHLGIVDEDEESNFFELDGEETCWKNHAGYI